MGVNANESIGEGDGLEVSVKFLNGWLKFCWHSEANRLQTRETRDSQ